MPHSAKVYGYLSKLIGSAEAVTGHPAKLSHVEEATDQGNKHSAQQRSNRSLAKSHNHGDNRKQRPGNQRGNSGQPCNSRALALTLARRRKIIAERQHRPAAEHMSRHRVCDEMRQRQAREQNGATQQRKYQGRSAIAPEVAIVENCQPLFLGPADQAIGKIGKTIFVQTPGDQHQVQQHGERGDWAGQDGR